ncbi:hypothetical protein EJ03DRAFT_210178 [Teratosphaeria nubilosa]|uniref:Uncharacterized protein n=1 Tax=Teratosphaeria nubilosa TaxID=161662 RepID=A0A6G1KXD1_9PEZI|nr:hypothetical protein EJ03DRAFT_210178 [Teratosphaeria nubilosa]
MVTASEASIEHHPSRRSISNTCMISASTISTQHQHRLSINNMVLASTPSAEHHPRQLSIDRSNSSSTSSQQTSLGKIISPSALFPSSYIHYLPTLPSKANPKRENSLDIRVQLRTAHSRTPTAQSPRPSSPSSAERETDSYSASAPSPHAHPTAPPHQPQPYSSAYSPPQHPPSRIPAPLS